MPSESRDLRKEQNLPLIRGYGWKVNLRMATKSKSDRNDMMTKQRAG